MEYVITLHYIVCTVWLHFNMDIIITLITLSIALQAGVYHLLHYTLQSVSLHFITLWVEPLYYIILWAAPTSFITLCIISVNIYCKNELKPRLLGWMALYLNTCCSISICIAYPQLIFDAWAATTKYFAHQSCTCSARFNNHLYCGFCQ